jgi:pimeloyl-ACP methyl ester carboxylesterase
MMRERVRFQSGDAECVGWHYRGTNGACVVMAGGFAVTKEPATDQFAKRFHEAGYSVLGFDYRHLGESGGQPRLVLPIGDQLADWHAAVGFASTLQGVDADKIAIWGFSASGGYVLEVAADNPRVAAAIAQTPGVDGPAALRTARRHQTQRAMLRFTGRAVLDALGGLLRRPPRLVPLVGAPGTVAMLTTPDAFSDWNRALDPDDAHSDWQRMVAARSAMRMAFYRPIRYARSVQCPLLVLICEQDQSAVPGPAIQAADRAPHGELVRMPGGHYEPFLAGHEVAVEAELSFLRRHLLEPRADAPLAARARTQR